MSGLFYCSVLAAGIGLLGCGRILLCGAPLGRQFLAGLLFISAIGGSLAYLAPLVIIPFSRGAIIVGCLVCLYSLRSTIRVGIQLPDRRIVLCGILATLIGIGFALPYHFRFASILEANYYLGQIVEYFLADYIGPLRIPNYYPYEMAASHVQASAAIAVMAALMSHGTMLDGLEIRFLLVAFTITRISFVVLYKAKYSPYLSVPLVVAGLLVFMNEMYQTFDVSSYIFMMLMAELSLTLYHDDQPLEHSARDVLFLLIGMVGAKASIFYLPALVALWVCLRFPRLVLHPVAIAQGVVTLMMLVVLLFQPKPFSDVDIKLSFFNLAGGRAAFDYYPRLHDVLIDPHWISDILPVKHVSGVLLLFLVVALKYWILPIRALSAQAAALSQGRREIIRVAEIYLLVALVSLVLIRHEQHGTAHQIWVIYGAAPLAMLPILSRALDKNASWLWKGGLIAIAMAAIILGDTPLRKMAPLESRHLGGVNHYELMQMKPKDAMMPRPGDRVDSRCQRALLKGIRVLASDVPLACASTLGTLALEPKK